MAKTQVKNKTGAIVKNSQKELAAKVNAALVRAGMRYGDGEGTPSRRSAGGSSTPRTNGRRTDARRTAEDPASTVRTL